MEPRRHEGARVLTGAHADQEGPREVEREPDTERRHDVLSIQRWMSAGGETVAVRQGERRQHPSRRFGRVVGGPGVDLPDRLPGLEPVADLASGTRDPRRGRSGRLSGSGPRRARRSPCRSPRHPRRRAYRPRSATIGTTTGAAGRIARGSSTTCGSPPCASTMRGSARAPLRRPARARRVPPPRRGRFPRSPPVPSPRTGRRGLAAARGTSRAGARPPR